MRAVKRTFKCILLLFCLVVLKRNLSASGSLCVVNEPFHQTGVQECEQLGILFVSRIARGVVQTQTFASLCIYSLACEDFILSISLAHMLMKTEK